MAKYLLPLLFLALPAFAQSSEDMADMMRNYPPGYFDQCKDIEQIRLSCAGRSNQPQCRHADVLVAQCEVYKKKSEAQK